MRWRCSFMAYSHSQLETYQNCPLKYRLQYVDRIRTGRKSIEAFMGSTVHAALEKLYRDVLMSRCPSEDEIADYYQSLWDTTISDDVFVVRQDYCVEDYRQTGLRCVRDYHRRHYPFAGGAPVWLERKVVIPLEHPSGERVDFTGILDRLDSLGEGRYEIHDYKTSTTLPSRHDLERDRQLSLYQLAVEDAFEDAREVELVWHYLAFDRELRLRRERSDLERIAAEAAATVRAIESCEDFPARESALCGWCELQAYCPKRKHPVMVMEMRERELGMERGAQLADQYAEWSRRKKEAEERLGELREEILEFSSYHAVDNIQGSSCMLKLSRGRAPKLPPDGCEQRDELERVLRQCGAWEDASRLDARRAASLLEREDIDREVRACLAALISWEETPTLRVSRRRD